MTETTFSKIEIVKNKKRVLNKIIPDNGDRWWYEVLDKDKGRTVRYIKFIDAYHAWAGGS